MRAGEAAASGGAAADRARGALLGLAIRGGGYVVASLEAALWAFATTDSFEEGALAAVNLGDDADTTGAVYGQIAGAHYGASGIPAAWLRRLARRGVIEGYAEALHGLDLQRREGG